MDPALYRITTMSKSAHSGLYGNRPKNRRFPSLNYIVRGSIRRLLYGNRAKIARFSPRHCIEYMPNSASIAQAAIELMGCKIAHLNGVHTCPGSLRVLEIPPQGTFLRLDHLTGKSLRRASFPLEGLGTGTRGLRLPPYRGVGLAHGQGGCDCRIECRCRLRALPPTRISSGNLGVPGGPLRLLPPGRRA